MELHTEIVIAASAERVWQELVDFSSYPQWNPLVPKASGELREGGSLDVRLAMGRRTIAIKPKLVRVTPNRELAWRGRLPVPGLFAGEHSFEILPGETGTVRFHHWEKFDGLLVPLMRRMLNGRARRGFEAMNAALKTRAERPQT